MAAEQGSDGELAEGVVLEDRFELVAPIGSGRRGHVWRATRLEDGETVVIKVLDSAVAADPEARGRFEREAVAASRVAHPNCAAISDVGALPDGRMFLVTDYLDGELLSAYLLRKQRLAMKPAMRIVRHVLCGLRHAHGAGVVHRDVRPANIMLVERDGDREFAVVLDFGLAKLVGDAGAGKQQLTAVGLALGDISYAAPEQMTGGAIDGRSDLYAVTAVLVQMLTGAPPPAGDDGATVAEGLDLPLKGKDLVRWGLERDRMRRVPSADRYITEIDSILGDRAPSMVPTIAAPVVPPPEAARARGTAGPQSQTMQAPVVKRPRSLPRWFRPAALAAGALAAVIGFAAIASQCEDTDALLDEYRAELRSGADCEVRREAVYKLDKLGDKRAIPALRNAREREGNGCLRKDALSAIQRLRDL